MSWEERAPHPTYLARGNGPLSAGFLFSMPTIHHHIHTLTQHILCNEDINRESGQGKRKGLHGGYAQLVLSY